MHFIDKQEAKNLEILDELQGEGTADNQPPRADCHAFVVRIWKESMDEQGKAIIWHGSIDYVGGNRRLYFYNIDTMAKFILEQAEIRSRKPLDWARRLKAWLLKYAHK